MRPSDDEGTVRRSAGELSPQRTGKPQLPHEQFRRTRGCCSMQPIPFSEPCITSTADQLPSPEQHLTPPRGREGPPTKRPFAPSGNKVAEEQDHDCSGGLEHLDETPTNGNLPAGDCQAEDDAGQWDRLREAFFGSKQGSGHWNRQTPASTGTNTPDPSAESWAGLPRPVSMELSQGCPLLLTGKPHPLGSLDPESCTMSKAAHQDLLVLRRGTSEILEPPGSRVVVKFWPSHSDRDGRSGASSEVDSVAMGLLRDAVLGSRQGTRRFRRRLVALMADKSPSEGFKNLEGDDTQRRRHETLGTRHGTPFRPRMPRHSSQHNLVPQHANLRMTRRADSERLPHSESLGKGSPGPSLIESGLPSNPKTCPRQGALPSQKMCAHDFNLDLELPQWDPFFSRGSFKEPSLTRPAWREHKCSPTQAGPRTMENMDRAFSLGSEPLLIQKVRQSRLRLAPGSPRHRRPLWQQESRVLGARMTLDEASLQYYSTQA